MPFKDLSDDELLFRARSESRAFETFYRRYVALVTGYFVNRTRSPELAADLTAETFACLLEAVGQFDAQPGRRAAGSFASRIIDSSTRCAAARSRLGLARDSGCRGSS